MGKKLRENRSILFRIGLSSFFLVNSISAWVAAGEFRDLLTSNSITSHIGHTNSLIYLIGINDALLFLLILSGRYRKLVVVWGSLWLVAVIFVTGFWTTDFIEHIGVLALLACYPFI